MGKKPIEKVLLPYLSEKRKGQHSNLIFFTKVCLNFLKKYAIIKW